jgi:predicted  nucleic acid-binding Zn-ribbon protein
VPKDSSPLTEAATAFDAELAVYARLGELFLKTPLTSLKQLERANQLINEIADCEQRLQDAGKTLITALTAARGRQEGLSNQVVAHAPTVQARNAQLRDLMMAMGTLATDAAAINARVLSPEGDAAKPDTTDVSSAVLDIAERAQKLAADAHDAQFEELSQQAHSLHQRLKALGQKLSKAGGN